MRKCRKCSYDAKLRLNLMALAQETFPFAEGDTRLGLV